MKNIKKIIVVLIIIVIAFLYAHVDKMSYFYDRKQDSGDYIATGILADRELSQEFYADTDEITGIQVKTSVYGEVDNVIVIYQLKDNDTNGILAEGAIEGEEFQNSKFYDFKFDGTINLKGKNLTLILNETGSNEMNGVGFSIGQTGKDNISGKLIIDGKETQGTLVARTIRHGFDFETFFVFLAFVAYIVIFMKLLYKLFK